MKPIEDWLEEEHQHFLTLLVGRCWHEYKREGGEWNIVEPCLKCGKIRYPRITITFDTIKTHMKQRWPELWEGYLTDQETLYKSGFGEVVDYTKTLDKIMDLHNFAAWMLRPEQAKVWGWVDCHDPGDKTCFELGCVSYTEPCQHKIKHPAIVYTEGL